MFTPAIVFRAIVGEQQAESDCKMSINLVSVTLSTFTQPQVIYIMSDVWVTRLGP